MTVDQLEVQECVHIDKDMKEGILYLSRRFELAIHLCACGCKEETVTPLLGIGEKETKEGWNYSEGPNGPTLWPSIGNQKFKCKSHYYVTDGKIELCSDHVGIEKVNAAANNS